MKKPLLIILLIGLVLRLVGLNQSLWLDEATTARVVQQFNFIEIISKFSPTDFHPPLYYLLMKVWTIMFGYSEIALRLPSIIFALLTGWMIYLIGKQLKNEQVGLGSAIFFLLNPLSVYYSQEARMYMMVTFLLTTAVYFLLKKRYLHFNIAIFLSFLTFYGSVLFIASIFLWYLWKRKYSELFKLLPGLLVAGLLISPLFIQQFINSRRALSSVVNWSLVLGKANIKNFFLIPIKFSIGRISFEPKVLYWVVSGIWTAVLGLFVWFGSKKNKNFFFWLMATLVIAFIVSFNSPLLQYFRFIYLLPLFSILLAYGTSQKWQRAIITGGLLIFSLVYLINPNFYREDWKSLVKDLPKDKKIYMIQSSSDPVLYYNSKIKITDLRDIKKENGKDIVVIPYTVDIHGVDYRKDLTDSGYKLKETKTFRELTYERWLKQGFYYSEKVSAPLY